MKSVKMPWKSKRLSRKVCRVAMVSLTVAIATIFSSALSIYFYSNNSSTVRADAAIVLGAAAWGKEPSPVFRERINHGINLYQTKQVNKLIFTGGKGDGDELAESTVGRNYAIRYGVLERDIFTETQSRTTYQNLYQAKRIVQDHSLRELLIVSDPLHMKRSVLMAKNLGLDAYPSPTPTTRYKTLKSKLQFLVRETYFYLHYRVSRLLPSVYNS